MFWYSENLFTNTVYCKRNTANETPTLKHKCLRYAWKKVKLCHRKFSFLTRAMCKLHNGFCKIKETRKQENSIFTTSCVQTSKPMLFFVFWKHKKGWKSSTYKTYFKYCEAVHHYILIPSIREEEQAVAPCSILLCKIIQQLLCRKKEVGMITDRHTWQCNTLFADILKVMRHNTGNALKRSAKNF